ncbi:11576_t:CDS:10 [Funneliformis geosporum]|uniref:11576_t:CDS:1 n=1 Tax=Funneliformis geosporum TaxID=1117311 RepID=A0A9W4WWJ5_9GLOM|nr:11576_t:CDS:10 [Funneliformis geosporum]
MEINICLLDSIVCVIESQEKLFKHHSLETNNLSYNLIMDKQYFDSERGRRRRGKANNDRRRDGDRGQQSQRPPPPNIPEIKKAQHEATMENFRSSELTYKGSDRIITIPNGDLIKFIWKKILKKDKEPLNQSNIRIFISSALVATSYQSGYEVDELVSELGDPNGGLKMLREIINFPSMSCDAGLNQGVLSFQYVILPLLGLLTRTSITECILEKYVHAIFMVVYTNLDYFLYDNVMKMLGTLVQRNSVIDYQVSVELLLRHERYSFIPTSLGIFFIIIVRLLTVLLRRIKEASINETMHKIAQDLHDLKTTYQQSIQQQQPSATSTDPLINNLETRNYFFMILDKEMNIMSKLLNNGRVSLIDEQNPNKKELISKLTSLRYNEMARKSDMERIYDPPGGLSKYGKRHNNDFEEISKISIIPTIEEILCDRPPFLPFSLPDAPHFLPDGAAKLLDTQFRLLREDMLNFIRGSVSNLLTALSRSLKPSLKNSEFSKELRRIQKEFGGLHVYTNPQFIGITCDKKKGFVYTLSFTPPKCRNSHHERDRQAFWVKSKRLLTGSLVTLLLPNPYAKYSVYFGVVATRDENDLARDPEYSYIGINFVDLSIYPIALDEISNPHKVTENSLEQRFMVESTVEPPMYARAPDFEFDLSVICNKKRNLKLNVANTSGYDEVAKKINDHSKLDETQAKALISALTREIALIEGPPGTGKTVVGVEIMKVLLAKENRKTNLGPILTICFTNHALDQFLEHLLDVNIKNIVRLGSRTKSERIKAYNIEEVCRNIPFGKNGYDLRKSLNEIESRVKEIGNNFSKSWLKWNDVSKYLMTKEPNFYNKFERVSNEDLPSWVLGTYSGEEEFFKPANNKSENFPIFEKWVRGKDFEVIKTRKYILLNPQQKDQKPKEKSPSRRNKFEMLQEEENNANTSDDDESETDHDTINWILNYKEPETDRPLESLLNLDSIWEMSRLERKTLHDYWRTKVNQEFIESLSRLQKMYENKRKFWSNMNDEVRRQALLRCDVIGMTTNGAAKFQSLISKVNPKVIICEEAGEVLEAHILSTLTSETQQLILIGDPNQLRPHIATYSLSMDSSLGKNYQLDKSLFERLVNGDKATKIEKVQLSTQRRMRKNEISDLIRYTLYPNLVDAENTAKYPKVRGAQHNVYFIDHHHPEVNPDGDFAAQSHVNIYEVKMVVEMVKYFIKNGYTKPDDIAVLTPYLGQMMRIKEALSELFVVVLDERDEQNLAEMEEQEVDNDIIENVKVSEKSLYQQVTLRTIDNYQGEEANIVIISLVRNFSKSDRLDTIGFLKSTNRSNVLLSRAREGMYLLGNSELMETKSKDMWAPVINILRTRNPAQIGFGMPIACNKHPKYKNVIVEPEQFELVSPTGGCFELCRAKLPCGHTCTSMCHTDDPQHLGTKCLERCPRLHPVCNHPCPKICYENCGLCYFPIGDIKLLGCGHVLKNVTCWQYQKKDLRCLTTVKKQLISCEHSKTIYCYESVENVKCEKECGEVLKCNHRCSNQCFQCQNLSKPRDAKTRDEDEVDDNIVPIERTVHGKCKQFCNKLLFCGHKCAKYCHEGSACPPCNDKCIVTCKHASCNLRCIEPCSLCAKECSWECEHQGRCKLSCGIPCNKLPCNESCNKMLECGHNCAGVCGEICPSKDFCIICAPEHVKRQVSDAIKNISFSKVDWKKKRMIVLSCGHVYTMETMDMHMGMEGYYECEGVFERNWTSVKILPASTVNVKACPECRTPIKNIRRYGRIINKYIMDAQNKKFLTKYDNQLSNVTKRVISLEDMMKNKRKLLSALGHLPAEDTRLIEIVSEVLIDESEIIPHNYYKNVEKYHGFEKFSKKIWLDHVEELLKCYKELTFILYAAKSPPHIKAFEASTTSLYQNADSHLIELSNSKASSSTFSNKISDSSKYLLSQTGISISKIDRRIYLDTFFELVNVQKFLFNETLFIIQEISKAEKPIATRIKNVWYRFAENLQFSIQKHLNTIKEVSRNARYGRHLLLTNVEILELELNKNVYQLKYSPNRISPRLISMKICRNVRKEIMNTRCYEYSFAKGIFKNAIDIRLQKLLEACNTVETSSIEGKLEIHRLMQNEFISSGHLYVCSNGHPYTVGESDCVQVKMQIPCPDCDANIEIGNDTKKESSNCSIV